MARARKPTTKTRPKPLKVTRPILHQGKVYPVGSTPPELAPEQVERLKRIGHLG